MIAIDSSALLAILFGEPEKGAFHDVNAGCDRLIVSAVNVHEMAAVLRVTEVWLPSGHYGKYSGRMTSKSLPST